MRETTEYWVVGGRYASTDFAEFAPGYAEERLGPFDSYEKAKKVWQEQAWKDVDNCHARYQIVENAPAI